MIDFSISLLINRFDSHLFSLHRLITDEPRREKGKGGAESSPSASRNKKKRIIVRCLRITSLFSFCVYAILLVCIVHSFRSMVRGCNGGLSFRFDSSTLHRTLFLWSVP